MRIRRLLREAFRREDGLDKRLFWFITLSILGIELISIILDSLTGLNPQVTYMNIGILLVTVVNALIAAKSGAYIVCYTILCLIINVVFIPLEFLAAGGFASGMPIYVALAAIVCAVHPGVKLRTITAVISLICYLILFWIVINRPELVRTIPPEIAKYDRFAAIVISGVVITVLMSFIVGDINALYKQNIKEFQSKTQMRLELLESQVENIEEAKHQRNEMRRHNMIITEFAEKGDVEGLLGYLKEKKLSDEKYNRKNIYSMNGTLNSVLDIYARQAQKKKIPMDIKTDVPSTIGITDPDLVTMVSSILENALNGAENSGTPDRKVSVNVYSKDSKLVILVKNSCNRKLVLIDGYPGHPGIGTGIVEKIVREYGGMMEYKIENGVIECKLIIHAGDSQKA